MEDLFDVIDDADRRRLTAAGWAEVDYSGGRAWLSPDGRETVSQEEALRRLDAGRGDDANG